eukprot:TRINITY_DN1546_c0_g1_i17.p1 TRINITY_DN1546_c0_g1~~TRINITY_DN1546_c0_g1_i17.p1  ORF type:complete len:249 (+),score=23.62 TRINITY_DN1546_c0_g1_i17:160-906(+)
MRVAKGVQRVSGKQDWWLLWSAVLEQAVAEEAWVGAAQERMGGDACVGDGGRCMVVCKHTVQGNDASSGGACGQWEAAMASRSSWRSDGDSTSCTASSWGARLPAAAVHRLQGRHQRLQERARCTLWVVLDLTSAHAAPAPPAHRRTLLPPPPLLLTPPPLLLTPPLPQLAPPPPPMMPTPPPTTPTPPSLPLPPHCAAQSRCHRCHFSSVLRCPRRGFGHPVGTHGQRETEAHPGQVLPEKDPEPGH